MAARISPLNLLIMGLMAGFALFWSTPLLWMLTASLRPDTASGLGMASLAWNFSPTTGNFWNALESANFPLFYLNTILVCAGTLAIQLITITLAGYAFARLEFPFKTTIFTLFLLQLMLAAPILIVPNLIMVARLGLYDTLFGVMAPYCASAFGVFLMRQTFMTIPKDFEEAAMLDGANWWQMLTQILVPLAKPGLVAFSIVSVTTHWTEFLWPLMVTSSPSNQTLTVGLASFARGAERSSEWGLIAAGTLLVAGPLLIAFVLFQKQFINSFLFSGIK